MKKLLSNPLIILLLVPIIAHSADNSMSEFDILKNYFLTIPAGTNLKKIEKEIDLPQPDKTYMGSSSYNDRLFRYYGFRGLILQIGLKQVSKESSYSKGDFIFNGDFTIIDSDKEYSRCCFDNGWSSIYSGPTRK